MSDFEKHNALVSNVDDPDQLGRVKIKCASFLREDSELPWWIPPRVPWLDISGGQWFAVPAKDTWVEVLLPTESRWDEVPFEQSLQMEGSGMRYLPTTFNDLQKVHTYFKTNYPQRYGVVYPGGWIQYIDAKSGELNLAYVPDENEDPEAWIKISSDKSITIQNSDGMKLQILETKVIVEAAGPVEINGDNVSIGDPGATEKIPLGNALVSYLNSVATGFGSTHTHVCAAPGSPSGVPVPTMTAPVEANLVSGKHTVEK